MFQNFQDILDTPKETFCYANFITFQENILFEFLDFPLFYNGINELFTTKPTFSKDFKESKISRYPHWDLYRVFLTFSFNYYLIKSFHWRIITETFFFQSHILFHQYLTVLVCFFYQNKDNNRFSADVFPELIPSLKFVSNRAMRKHHKLYKISKRHHQCC